MTDMWVTFEVSKVDGLRLRSLIQENENISNMSMIMKVLKEERFPSKYINIPWIFRAWKRMIEINEFDHRKHPFHVCNMRSIKFL